MLRQATSTEYHSFVPCDISVLDADAVSATRVHGPKQVTDVYLLALAVQHGMRFATFDDAIAISAVPGATEANMVII